METKYFSLKTIILAVIVVLLGALGIYLSNVQKTPGTTVIQAKSQLVSGFPDVPLYPRATIESSQYNPPSAANYYKGSYQVNLEVKDKVPNIMGWTMQALIAKGYTIDTPPDSATPEDQSIFFSRDGMKGTVNAEAEGDKTDVVIYIVNK